MKRSRTHAPMGLHHVSVTAVRDVTPRMRRFTVSAESLASFTDDGPDQRFKLFLPRPGQLQPSVTDGEGWYQAWQALPDAERPTMRTYTVRASRPELAELDFDIALHGDSGPGSAWAERARPGDRVAVFGAYAEHDPDPDARWHLLVGDETALPAIAAIAERLPAGLPVRAVVEVADDGEVQDLAGDADTKVTWVRRASGERLVAAVRDADLPAGRGYAWLAGESAAVTTLRRHLLNERGFAKDQVTFMGYWRRGESIDPS